MHKEIESLKFKDQDENLSILKTEKFKRDCKIDEKHIALSLMNSDKKLYFDNYNDKYRSKLAKERGYNSVVSNLKEL